jgi:hypothetical protein
MDTKSYFPHCAEGSSNELLWILIVFKKTCKYLMFKNAWVVLPAPVFNAINTLMASESLAPITMENFDRWVINLDYEIDTICLLLRLRSDLIIEIRKHRARDRQNSDQRRDAKISEMEATIRKLKEENDQHTPP